MIVRTRFAPSPTGRPHIGSIWLALFSYIWAKQNNGQFILRIDDTDQERLVAESEQEIKDVLLWFGINYDAYYKQSERLEIYHKHCLDLISSGNAYYCFCSKDRLDSLRAIQQNNHQPTKYDRYCLALADTEISSKLNSGVSKVVRLKIPDDQTTTVMDIVRGEIVFKNNLLDDSVLLKSDGYPTYHLASIVDDHLMEITHVIRAEEWLSSAPKHIILYRAFNWEVPKLAHLPLILGTDRSKLSKRHGAVAALDFRDLGYLKDAFINFLVLLGWNPKNNQEIFSLDQLIKEFSFEKMNKSGAIFDINKLDWFNHYYIQRLSIDELLQESLPFITKAKLPATDLEFVKRILTVIKDRLRKLSEFQSLANFFFALPDYEKELLPWKAMPLPRVKDRLQIILELFANVSEEEFTSQNLERLIKNLISEKSFEVGETCWPLRVALTGVKNSPGPFDVAWVLGKPETLTRIKIAIQKLS